jgi:N-acetylmuramoyl-L-alanine amidase
MNTNQPIWVIDAGHGGAYDELGSSANHARGGNGLLEKDLTLDIATRVGRLVCNVADVRLTRSTDVNLPLSARARIASDAGATLFVSLHLNGSRDPGVDGTEAWIARTSNSHSAALARELAARVSTATGGPNRGVKQRNLGVLLPERHSPGAAACLLEIAFLTNPAQAGRFMRSEYRDAVAAAIADGLRQTLHPGTSTALGTDGPADYPKELRVYWAAPHERLFHSYWHQARQAWPRLNKKEREDISTFGLTVPPPRMAGTSGAGLDFLFMHRSMVQGTRSFAVARKLKYRPTGWSPIPWNHNDAIWPMPVISELSEAKEQEITDFWKDKVRNEYDKTTWLQGIELDDLGTTIEEGIHNWLHMHWASDEPANPWDVSVSNDWLGHPFSAAVNPAFWKLHGWIDELIDGACGRRDAGHAPRRGLAGRRNHGAHRPARLQEVGSVPVCEMESEAIARTFRTGTRKRTSGARGRLGRRRESVCHGRGSGGLLRQRRGRYRQRGPGG